MGVRMSARNLKARVLAARCDGQVVSPIVDETGEIEAAVGCTYRQAWVEAVTTPFPNHRPPLSFP